MNENLEKKSGKSSRVCSLWWCSEPFKQRGYCKRHSRQFHRTGTPVAGRDGRVLYSRTESLHSLLREIRHQALVNDGAFVHCVLCGTSAELESLLAHDSDCVIPRIDAILLSL